MRQVSKWRLKYNFGLAVTTAPWAVEHVIITSCYVNLAFFLTDSHVVFWDVMPCSLIESCQCLRGTATIIFNMKFEARDSSEIDSEGC
jgi:hypothetical protein